MRPVFLLIVSTLLLCNNAMATEIYRHVNENGDVIYSDQAQEGAERVEVAPTNIDESPKIRRTPVETEAQAKAEQLYTTLLLTEPENDRTFRHVSEVKLVAELTPALSKKHMVRFLRNGSPLGEPTRDLSYTAKSLYRGSHTFSVEVIDAEGEAIITSDPVTVHIHRTSIINSPHKTSVRTNTGAQ